MSVRHSAEPEQARLLEQGPVACALCGRAISEDSARCPGCDRELILAGRYRITRRLGEGGSASVYEAIDLEDHSKVAVKVMGLEQTHDFKVLELFVRGTDLLRGLDHPRLPRVYSFERDAAGRAYQVRELYEGGSLYERIRVQRRHVDRREVHRFLRDMLELLDYLHTRVPAVVHRDLKPSNVLFRGDGTEAPVLVDFDAATAGAPDGTGTTIVVSPGYSAPEQLAGDAQPASDLYSLGMTVLFMITHRDPSELPRKKGRFDVDAHLTGLGPATSRVIKGLIETDLSRRYQSASAALQALTGRPSPRSIVTTGSLRKLFSNEVRPLGASVFRIAVGVLLGWMLLNLAMTLRHGSSTRNNVRGVAIPGE